MTQAPTPDPALVRAVGQLWPGARLEVVAARRHDPGARAELVAFPDLPGLRLLLPTASRPAAGALHRFSAAASPVEVAARVVAGGAFRRGAGRLLPHRLRLHGGEPESIVEHLAAALGRSRVHVSLSLGPARVNRKPVLQVFDDHGRSLGFAKVGATPAASAVVTAEAAALERLQSHSFRRLRVPGILALTHWRGMPVLVQEDLGVRAGPLLRRRPGRLSRPDAAMEEVATVSDPAAGSSWWQRCLERGRRATDPGFASRWGTVMETLAARLPESLPMGAWHGDWTSWNCAPGPDGRTLVWDWERFETDVPQGLDRVHYDVNQAVARHGTSAAVILGAARGSTTPPVAAAYLATITARYLEMSSQEHGDLVAARCDETLTALERLLAGPV